MNATGLYEKLEVAPIIAAVKNDDGLKKAICCESEVIFVLYGNINNIASIVQTAKNADKFVFVHIDLVDGLAAKEASVDFIAKNTCAHGIISTKPNLIKYAKSVGLLSIQRFFVLDSLALENIRKADKKSEADFIEILPALMPKIITRLTSQIQKPIIAGGLVSDKDDVVTALRAGAIAVSSTCEDVWFL